MMESIEHSEPIEYVPSRGDLVWISLDPTPDEEQVVRRPAVILSPIEYNARLGLALLCPIVGEVKGYPFEVIVPEGLPVEGAILSDQVRSLNWRVRTAEPVGKLPPQTVSEVLGKLTTLLAHD
jgi:mRNA interferase MazF